MPRINSFLLLFVFSVSVCFSQTRPSFYQLKDFPLVSPTAYGAVGDGVTDDSAAIQSCITANDGVLIDKTYRIDATLQLHSGISIVGTPNGKIITSTVAFNASGSTSDITTLSSGSSSGDTTFSVVDASGLAEGDNIILVAYGSKPSASTYDYREKFTILDITGTTITVDRRIGYDYLSGATVTKLSLLDNVALRNINFTSDGSSNLITGTHASNMVIDSCFADGNNEAGFAYLTTCFNTTISNCVTKNTYGSWLVECGRYCSGISVTNNKFLQHYSTGDGAITFWGNVLDSIISNNILSGSSSGAQYGISIHFGSRNCSVIGNSVSGFYYGLYNLYASNNNIISGNSFTNNLIGAHLDAVSYTTITGNSFKSKNYGILASGSSDLSISDNQIESLLVGIYLRSSNYDTISCNKIVSATRIQFSGTGFYYPRILNNIIHSENYGITSYFGGVSGIFRGNVIVNSDDSTGTGIRCSAMPFSIIEDNYISGCFRGIRSDYNSYCTYIRNNQIYNCASYAITLDNPSDSSVVSNVENNRIASCGADIFGGATSKPSLGSALTNAPLGFIVPNNPTDWTAARTVYGWKLISTTATGTSAWSAISLTEE